MARFGFILVLAIGASGLASGFALDADALLAQEPTVERRLDRLEARLDSLARRLEGAEGPRAADLERQLDAVLRELERVRVAAAPETPVSEEGEFGFAPAASRVYRTPTGVSLGGYGEILFESFADEREDGSPSGRTAQLDALRAILYVGYRFSDRVLFNSELEFEHAATDRTGSVSVEFAYIDYLLGDRVGLRGGLLLVPMGFINEIHEPTAFLGTERPVTEQVLIPSTWRENGFGAFAEIGEFSLRGYLVNGLDGSGVGSSGASGFSAAGLRNGRQKGSRAIAEDMAAVVRADWAGVPGLMIGGSAYWGGSDQGAALESGESLDVGTSILEAHGQYRARGFDVRGLIATAELDDVAALNGFLGLTGAESVGERLTGGYVQVGYDVLGGETRHQLVPYVRWERLDTQAAVPDGFAKDPANERSVLSLGAAWRPLTGMILKADYQIHSNEAETGTDQFNVALGYAF